MGSIAQNGLHRAEGVAIVEFWESRMVNGNLRYFVARGASSAQIQSYNQPWIARSVA